MGTGLEVLTTGLVERGGGFQLVDGIENSDISFPDDGLSKLYDIEEESYWFKHRNVCFGHLVNKYSGGGVFLDIGGGNGVVSKALQDDGLEVVLVEPDPIGCRNAVERGVSNVFSGTLEDLPLRPGIEVPSIGVFDVLEHIDDDLAALEGFYSVLSEGGHLFLSVPAFNFLWSEEDVHAGHFRRYTKRSITEVVERVGFEIVEVGYLFSVLCIPILIMRSIPSWFGFYKVQGETVNRDHGSSGGLVSRFVSRRLKSEFNRLKSGSGKMVGSSLYLVARKTG